VPHRFAATLILAWAMVPVTFAQTLIVDNHHVGFSMSPAGSWSVTGIPSYYGQWGDTYAYTSTDNSARTVEWRPDITQPGTYEIAVWYRSTGTSRPSDAEFTIYHAGGQQTVSVDQQIDGSTWVSLGSYSFNAGTTGYVTMTNQAEAGKTIVADAVRFHRAGIDPPQFRGYWADAFNVGFKSHAEIDAMISRAVAGGYNAIVPEILAYQDNVGNGHGAYWDSAIIPRASDIDPGLADPLAYMVQQAHAAGLEVHCWLVAFRVCTAWPPSGNSVVQPEWIMVPQAAMDTGPAPLSDGKYVLDPGSPDVQEYLVSIVRELVSNYPIDGIHWDYIRYTTTEAGYPSDLSYAKSGLKRFQIITPYRGAPTPNYSKWNDFRRREITEVVRRMRAEIPAIRSNPSQPLRHTGALITWGDAPSSFESTSAFASVFQNWREWMELGYLDAGIPMCYYRDHDPSHWAWYRNWVDAALGWRYDRHIYAGIGSYLNQALNGINQHFYALDAGAEGYNTYSYAEPATDVAVSTWYTMLGESLCPNPAPTPSMPWRDPNLAIEGTLYGRILDADTGEPVDDALVTLTGSGSCRTDGNGYYVITLADALPGGTSYAIIVSNTDYPTLSSYTATSLPGDVHRVDLSVAASCTTDVVIDGALNMLDVATLQAEFGCETGCAGDLDQDGDVDDAEAALLLRDLDAGCP
jgi:uncharacterized lipoprotein YddW (UPF0748 family)